MLEAGSADADDNWRGYVIMDLAIIDPVEAWASVDALKTYDDGNSKTNTLYWIATRPSSSS